MCSVRCLCLRVAEPVPMIPAARVAARRLACSATRSIPSLCVSSATACASRHVVQCRRAVHRGTQRWSSSQPQAARTQSKPKRTGGGGSSGSAGAGAAEAGEAGEAGVDPEHQAAIVAQARRMVALLSVGVGCLVASPMFYFVGKVVDRPLPDFVPPAIVGDWVADDGRTCTGQRGASAPSCRGCDTVCRGFRMWRSRLRYECAHHQVQHRDVQGVRRGPGAQRRDRAWPCGVRHRRADGRV